MVTPLAPQQLAGILPRQAVRMVQDALQAAGCPDADYDARELLRIAAGKIRACCLTRLPGRRLSAWRNWRLSACSGAAAIPGRRVGLSGVDLQSRPRCALPRADSEVVCETAIELLQQMGKPEPRVLDLCAGTGCLGIGIRHFVPGASVTCVEKARRRCNTCKPTYMAPVCRQRQRMCCNTGESLCPKACS